MNRSEAQRKRWRLRAIRHALTNVVPQERARAQKLGADLAANYLLNKAATEFKSGRDEAAWALRTASRNVQADALQRFLATRRG